MDHYYDQKAASTYHYILWTGIILTKYKHTTGALLTKIIAERAERGPEHLQLAEYSKVG